MPPFSSLSLRRSLPQIPLSSNPNSSSMASPSSPIDGSPLPITAPPQHLPSNLPPPPQHPTPSSRRLPPPCWTHDETIALIDSYRDKWYSLRRGNLKATHWQEVADSVSHRCPNASPSKTAVQCRHKMEKLRKRYRTELQRARSMPLSRFTSSWVHFKRMDAMEKGPVAEKAEESDSGGDEEEEEEDDDQDLYEEFQNAAGVSADRNVRKLYGNGINSGGGNGGDGAGAGGFRIRIPTGVSIAQPGLKNYVKSEQKMNVNPNLNPNLGMNMNPNFGTRVVRESNPVRPAATGKRGEREREGDPVAEMVSAIKALGDGFVRMERMKMDMAREIEAMRMEMEIKRTEMIMDSQQRIVEAFAKAVSENKKKTKRIPSPEP